MTICTECQYAIYSTARCHDIDFIDHVFCGHASVKRELRRKRNPVTGRGRVWYGDGQPSPYPLAYTINLGNCPMWKAKEKKDFPGLNLDFLPFIGNCPTWKVKEKKGGLFWKFWSCIFRKGEK